MPQPCPSIPDGSDATLVSEDTDAIDVIKQQSNLHHYNSRVLHFAMIDIAKLFLQYPDFQGAIISKVEDVFFSVLDDMYSAGVHDYDSDNINR